MTITEIPDVKKILERTFEVTLAISAKNPAINVLSHPSDETKYSFQIGNHKKGDFCQHATFEERVRPKDKTLEQIAEMALSSFEDKESAFYVFVDGVLKREGKGYS